MLEALRDDRHVKDTWSVSPSNTSLGPDYFIGAIWVAEYFFPTRVVYFYIKPQCGVSSLGTDFQNSSIWNLPKFTNSVKAVANEMTSLFGAPRKKAEIRNNEGARFGAPCFFPFFPFTVFHASPQLPARLEVAKYGSLSGTLIDCFFFSCFQILAALRAFLDVSINYYNISRMEAELIYNKYVWGSGTMAFKDITRFQSCPGVVTSYMLGQITFVKARRLMEESLGPKFSLPEFHYQVLRQGEIPLEYLLNYIRDLSDRWPLRAHAKGNIIESTRIYGEACHIYARFNSRRSPHKNSQVGN